MMALALYDAVASATVTAANPVRTAIVAAGLTVPGGVVAGAAEQGKAPPYLVLGNDTEAPSVVLPRDKGAVSPDVTMTAVAWATSLRKARQIAEAWGQAVLDNTPDPAGADVVDAVLDLSSPVGLSPEPNTAPAFGWAVRLRFTLDPS